jgi:hypothetical protein
MPDYFKKNVNKQVVSYIKDLSTHSDIADLFREALKPLGDVQVFCPDKDNFRYVCASTNGVIFGFAIGMHIIAFRLDERMRKRALITGGEAYTECGEEWIKVVHDIEDVDWPDVDVKFWALKSYVYARESLK